MKAKPIIIALVGPSGSGKTTLSMYFQDRLNIPAIVSFTTRPMREGEVNGRDHHFVNSDVEPDLSNVFAHTVFGGYHYWTNPEQFLTHRVSTYVVDEKGLQDMLDKWANKTFRVIPVYIHRPDNPTEDARKDRDKDRLTISPDVYEVNLVNDGTLEDLYREAIFKIGDIISRNWYWE